MKKQIIVGLLTLISLSGMASDATMYKWTSHFSYGSTVQVADAGDKVFGLAGGALFSVDKRTEEIETYSKINGLNGGEIAQITYDKQEQTLVIIYTDGLIDLLHDGQFVSIIDLQQKLLSSSKKANRVATDRGIAYLCMPFGIVSVDIANQQIQDTYYIGSEGSNIDVVDIAFSEDSLFALSKAAIYAVGRNDNRMDFRYWHKQQVNSPASLSRIVIWKGDLVVVNNQQIYYRQSEQWKQLATEQPIAGMKVQNDRLYVYTSSNGIYYLSDNYELQREESPYVAQDLIASGTTYWLATPAAGIARQNTDGTQAFTVNGPLVNIPYRMRISGGKLIMVPGGYYVAQTHETGCVMLYENNTWSNINNDKLHAELPGVDWIRNFSDAIIDPEDPMHYYVASYESGLYEFRNNHLEKWYYGDSLTIQQIIEPAVQYSFADALAFDSQNNLWMINRCNNKNIKIKMHDGRWVGLRHEVTDQLARARDLLIWNQNENWKIISCNHTVPGILVLNDNGTIENAADDQCVFRSEFVDQDNNLIRPEDLYSIAQTNDGAIWIGTESGLFVIDDPSKLPYSNACRKIKIPRNDGTNLADYLLASEKINALAVDGSNRVWIGTATSGLYLVSSDGIETIQHFTKDNSPLLDNTIISLAIDPTTGCVYIGTSKGLLSFQSDASPASENFDQIYAYPNPVRPDYTGVITIKGLMEESDVNIIDAAGNLVYKTRSNGGLAVWNGNGEDGTRVSSGVYTVLVNEPQQGDHAVTKILFLH